MSAPLWWTSATWFEPAASEAIAENPRGVCAPAPRAVMPLAPIASELPRGVNSGLSDWRASTIRPRQRSYSSSDLATRSTA